MNINEPTVPCGLCGRPTRMTGTKRCDRCYELESRIKDSPELARFILDGLGIKSVAAYSINGRKPLSWTQVLGGGLVHWYLVDDAFKIYGVEDR